MKKQNSVIVISIIFLFLMVIDLVSTLTLGDLVKYLEANPVYQYGGIIGILAINFLLIAVVYWLYKHSNSPATRFLYLNLMITICITRVLVIISNIRVGLNPPTIQQAMQVTTQMKMENIANMWWTAFIPYCIAILTFYLFLLDHKIAVKEKCQKD